MGEANWKLYCMGWIHGYVGFIEACNFPEVPLMAYESTTRDYEKPLTALQWAESWAGRNDNASS